MAWRGAAWFWEENLNTKDSTGKEISTFLRSSLPQLPIQKPLSLAAVGVLGGAVVVDVANLSRIHPQPIADLVKESLFRWKHASLSI
jgi:hypothetical protein